jgi:ABC-type uncharacterized transport system permease subunit
MCHYEHDCQVEKAVFWMPTTLLSVLAIALYLIAGTLLAVRLVRAPVGHAGGKGALVGVGLAGVVLHAAVLQQAILVAPGLDMGIANAASLITWFIALLLLLAALVKPVENLGIVILPLAAAGLAFAVWLPSDALLVSNRSAGLELHILLSIVAYSLLSIAAVQAVLLAIQESHLRNRRPGGFIRALPPLETMEGLLFQMIAVGFVLLSFALVTGFFFVEDVFAQHLVHKTVLSLLAWSVFATLLWGRRGFGWRGRTAIRWTLAGFFVLMLAYFGTKLVLELVLHRV